MHDWPTYLHLLLHPGWSPLSVRGCRCRKSLGLLLDSQNCWYHSSFEVLIGLVLDRADSGPIRCQKIWICACGIHLISAQHTSKRTNLRSQLCKAGLYWQISMNSSVHYGINKHLSDTQLFVCVTSISKSYGKRELPYMSAPLIHLT
jgi:hypothetical protein